MLLNLISNLSHNLNQCGVSGTFRSCPLGVKKELLSCHCAVVFLSLPFIKSNKLGIAHDEFINQSPRPLLLNLLQILKISIMNRIDFLTYNSIWHGPFVLRQRREKPEIRCWDGCWSAVSSKQQNLCGRRLFAYLLLFMYEKF